jgi:hypothetical protein
MYSPHPAHGTTSSSGICNGRSWTAGADLRAALTEILAELERDGWKAESNGEFGFVFVRRLEQRRLVTVTARDPYSTTAQSFSPFGEQRP